MRFQARRSTAVRFRATGKLAEGSRQKPRCCTWMCECCERRDAQEQPFAGGNEADGLKKAPRRLFSNQPAAAGKGVKGNIKILEFHASVEIHCDRWLPSTAYFHSFGVESFLPLTPLPAAAERRRKPRERILPSRGRDSKQNNQRVGMAMSNTPPVNGAVAPGTGAAEPRNAVTCCLRPTGEFGSICDKSIENSQRVLCPTR